MKKIAIIMFVGLVAIIGCISYIYNINFTEKLMSLFSNKVVYSNENIQKSKSDKKSYKYIVLNNGLRALLVSDPNTDMAAASMRVFAGSFDEPEGAEGIAHFTEHLLFLGNKKYPDSKDYSNYINTHRGRTNAFTSLRQTVYYFDIVDNHLFGALDIFAGFFSSPLFTESLVDKEKNAVDSEYKLHLKNDYWRKYHVDKITANKNHPYINFTIGNLQTLSNDDNSTLRNKVIDFYNKYYYAENMVLTVYGSQPLDVLQKFVVDKFSEIKKLSEDKIPNDGKIASIPRDYDSIPIYDKDNLGKIISFKTEGDKYHLYLEFPINNQLKQYLEKPADYVAMMLRRKDQGTLHKHLIDKNWITSMYVYHRNKTDSTSIFSVSFDLTESGIANYQEVIRQTFAYMKLILSNGISKWRFDEMKQILQTKFDFATQDNPIDGVVELTENINNIPIEEILVSDELFYNFNEKAIRELFSSLEPKNMRVILGAKNIKTDSIEPYFKVPYKIENITDDLIKQWTDIAPYPYFTLRGENEYLANNVSEVYSNTSKNKQPKLIIKNDTTRVWCMPDLQFAKPQINISTMLITNNFSDNVENNVLSKIYQNLLQEYISIKYASAVDALNYISVSRDKRGLIIGLQGYKLDILIKILSQVNTDITQFIPTNDRFLAIKDKMIRSYKDNLLSPPYYMCYSESSKILENNRYTALEESKIIQDITFAKLVKFIKNSFNNLSFEAFVYGGVKYSDISSDIAAKLSESLTINRKNDFNYVDQILELPIGDYHSSIETKHSDRSIFNVYLTKQRDYTTIGKLGLLSGIIKTHFYDEIRTQKQLGYVVQAGPYSIDTIIGIFNIVQSPNSDELKIKQAVDKFMQSSVLEILNKLTKNELDTHKSSLKALLLKHPNNRREVFDDKAFEILIKRYDFTRREKIAEIIDPITKDDLIQCYKELVVDPNTRTQFTVHTNKSEPSIWKDMKGL